MYQDFLLKKATILLQAAKVVSWYKLLVQTNSYYKIQRLLQIATVQTVKQNI